MAIFLARRMAKIYRQLELSARDAQTYQTGLPVDLVGHATQNRHKDELKGTVCRIWANLVLFVNRTRQLARGDKSTLDKTLLF